ncbi:MAG: tetrahydrofolate dehydrogenase/cyclohydrolase catalytic domain-containing protein [Patescibacteria group bacterium]|nr:tetrahydrofolate dehydrogenase/cyclohydrolase catalytic domain-containing protein [Patescibacteria group bacterium]
MQYDKMQLSDDITEANLLEEIKKINNDDNVDGFMIQLPLPKEIDENKVINAIDPSKDVD